MLQIILDETSANVILGKFDTTSSSDYYSADTENGVTNDFTIASSKRQFTSYEVKPDKTCIKKVIEEMNGIEMENKETTISCDQARQEVAAQKKEHEKRKKQNKQVGEDIKKDLLKMRSNFKANN